MLAVFPPWFFVPWGSLDAASGDVDLDAADRGQAVQGHAAAERSSDQHQTGVENHNLGRGQVVAGHGLGLWLQDVVTEHGLGQGWRDRA